MKIEVRSHFNSISSFYQRKKRESYLRLMKRSIGPVPKGRIADLGCGAGVALSWFEGEKVGVDFSANLLCQGPPGAEYVVADVESPPFRDQTLDTVLCLDVLEHLPSLKVIDEAHRILVPGGIFHLGTADRKFELGLEILEKLGLKLPEGPHKWVKTDEIRNKLNLAGFEFEDKLDPPIRFYRAVKRPA
jgi:SAM-dependent methyltransferase